MSEEEKRARELVEKVLTLNDQCIGSAPALPEAIDEASAALADARRRGLEEAQSVCVEATRRAINRAAVHSPSAVRAVEELTEILKALAPVEVAER